MGAERWDEQVGSVADEATRLLESLRRSAEAAAQSATSDPPAADPSGGDRASDAGAHGAAPSATAAEPGPAAHDPFCTWCPLCRGAAVVRSLSPETLARLADLAALAATVLTDLASSRTAGGQPSSEQAPDAQTDDATADGSGRPRRPARPRRTAPAPSNPIPISDADDPQEEPRG